MSSGYKKEVKNIELILFHGSNCLSSGFGKCSNAKNRDRSYVFLASRELRPKWVEVGILEAVQKTKKTIFL